MSELTFQTLVGAVAKILKGNHTHYPDNDSYGKITFEDGSGVLMYKDSYRKKIEISGLWPQDNKKESIIPYRSEVESYTQIGVSLDKAPEKIVRDIQNRFMPGYLPIYKKMVERRDQHNSYNNKAEDAKTHAKMMREEFRASFPDRYNVDIEAQGDSITIKINGLTPARARQILADYKKGVVTDKFIDSLDR